MLSLFNQTAVIPKTFVLQTLHIDTPDALRAHRGARVAPHERDRARGGSVPTSQGEESHDGHTD